MHVPFDEFEKVMNQCFEVFNTWDDEHEKFHGLMRDMAKKKREDMKSFWRVSPAHKKLQSRMEQMRKFRRQHEQLCSVIGRVLPPSLAQRPPQNPDEEQPRVVPEFALMNPADINAIEEVNLAYENVKVVDGLDISKEGTEGWEAALRRYEERIDRVETRITARLRDQLGTAKNANEMFRIFSRFNALFIRPHIRGAIREYQTQLIQRVKDDIEALHEKFKVEYLRLEEEKNILSGFVELLLCHLMTYEFVNTGSISSQQIVPYESHLGSSTDLRFHYLGQAGRTTTEYLHETCRRCSR